MQHHGCEVLHHPVDGVGRDALVATALHNRLYGNRDEET